MNEQPKNLPAQGFRQVAIANHGGGGMLMPQTFGDVVSFSEIMARSQHAIPKHLRDVPGACLAVTMQAMRWEMDPFAVASKSYNVKDIIAYEAQLVAAIALPGIDIDDAIRALIVDINRNRSHRAAVHDIRKCQRNALRPGPHVGAPGSPSPLLRDAGAHGLNRLIRFLVNERPTFLQ